MIKPIILASASPRRTQILHQIRLPHEIIPSESREIQPESGQSPMEFVKLSARLKLENVKQRYPDRLILSADTIVTQCNSILGKPGNFQDAQSMLTNLSGKCHQVLTAIALFHPAKSSSAPLILAETTDVVFRSLSLNEILWYLNTNEWKDKAGGYGIQGAGAALVQRINGCYYNVVGLPIALLLHMLNVIDAQIWIHTPSS